MVLYMCFRKKICQSLYPTVVKVWPLVLFCGIFFFFLGNFISYTETSLNSQSLIGQILVTSIFLGNYPFHPSFQIHLHGCLQNSLTIFLKFFCFDGYSLLSFLICILLLFLLFSFIKLVNDLSILNFSRKQDLGLLIRSTIFCILCFINFCFNLLFPFLCFILVYFV